MDATAAKPQRDGAPLSHCVVRGRELAMAPATAAGLSTGTHVMAPGTVTSVACGKSDASRRAWDTGKNWHCSPQISSTGWPNSGIAAAASMRSCGRKPAMAATRSPATRRSRLAGPENDSARSRSSPVAVTVASVRRMAAGQLSCIRIMAVARPGSARHAADALLSASGGNWS